MLIKFTNNPKHSYVYTTDFMICEVFNYVGNHSI